MPTAHAPGQTIGGFLLEELVHEGGMATLWRVTRPDIELPMVMKIPLLRHGESPATIVGFEAEQAIMPRLAGPHVPYFIAAGDFEEPFIVMERIEGSSLKSRVSHLPLPYEEVASL